MTIKIFHVICLRTKRAIMKYNVQFLKLHLKTILRKLTSGETTSSSFRQSVYNTIESAGMFWLTAHLLIDQKNTANTKT